MRIAITHLTKMREGRIGVAGVDVETRRFVRPLVWQRPIDLRDVAPNGGPFELGAVVDLGDVRPTPRRPSLENCEYVPRDVSERETVDGDEYWRLLRRLARPKLRGIFGGPLRYRGQQGAALEEGAGIASLGVLAPCGKQQLYVVRRPDGSHVPRLFFSDGELELFATVTDLRLYQRDGAALHPAALSQTLTRIAAGERPLLSVGLSQAFSRGPNDPPAHWLFVSNLHFEARPGWRLADTWQHTTDGELPLQASQRAG